jgi:hypothetical protein
MFRNDIAIIACYPHNLVYCHTLFHLVKRNFKHIFFIYSDVYNFDINKNYHKSLLNHNNVSVIKVDNIGYDFYKYYCGIREIKTRNLIFNKVWFINDSFFIGNWKYFCDEYKKTHGDIIGCYKSTYIKKHIQSFLLIMNERIMNLYYDFFSNYNFIAIDTESKKNMIISEIEINLNNNIINRRDVVFDIIFKFKDDPYVPCIHPIVYFGFNHGIYKSNAFSFCDTYDMKSPHINNFIHNGNLDHKILFCFLSFDEFKLLLDKNKHPINSTDTNNVKYILGKHIRFNNNSRLLHIILASFKNKQYKNKFIHKFISNFKNM